MTLNFRATISTRVYPQRCPGNRSEYGTTARHNADNLTLNDALHNLSDDTVLELERGEHCIMDSSLISGLHGVTIKGVTENSSDVIITCTHGNGLAFFEVDDLTIKGLTISQCGLVNETLDDFSQVVRESIEFFFHTSDAPDNYVAVACADCGNFTMVDVQITHTTGLGFLGINLFGNSHIERSTFSDNRAHGCFEGGNMVGTDVAGGGALILYHDYVNRSSNHGSCVLNIERSVFHNNSYCGSHELQTFSYYYEESFLFDKIFTLGEGGGLSIVLSQIHYEVNASVTHSNFTMNQAVYGSGANIEIFTAVLDSTIEFRHCRFTENGLEKDSILHTENVEIVTAGAGLSFTSDILQPTFNRSVDIVSDLDHVPCTITIADSDFYENRAFSGGAIFIISLYSPLLGGALQEELNVQSCRFDSNFGVVGGAIYAHEWKQTPFQRGLDVVFHDVNFNHNSVYNLGDVSTATQNSAIIELLKLNVTFSGHTVIANSDGTALSSSTCVIAFKDSVTFRDNSGSYGGAMRLEDGSLLLLLNNTHIIFANNTGAIFGGAMYISDTSVSPTLSQVDCYIYFGIVDFSCYAAERSSCPDITKSNVTISFDGNSSPLGSMVYGSTFEKCPWAVKFKEVYAPHSNLTLFEILYTMSDGSSNFTSPFVFDKPPNSTSEVATGTSSIVLDTTDITAMPGEAVTIGIQTLDQFNRSVPTIMTTLPSSVDRLQHSVSSLIGRSNYHLVQQNGDRGANNTVTGNITVFGDRNVDNVSISLYALLSLTQTQITVMLTNCSEGFTYVDDSRSCECSKQINDSLLVDCSVDDFTLAVHQDFWVGPGPDGKLIIKYCHFDHCLDGIRTIHPPNFDDQCQVGYNRTGIACGKCIEGLSMTFGSNSCSRCTNSFLAMILLYALLGVILVLAISFLQITVSGGYLNGVLFYANVINIYLPLLTRANSYTYPIFFLVSFLNLNLGFKTCFYNGMSALARTGLYLVFPFYIFFLMFVIVMIAKRSSRFSNWFSDSGFSASKVFVTLIIMSYSSLLETCIEILGFDRVESYDKDVYYLWRIDNNQRYFHGNHIFLGVVAIFLLCFLLPLPFLLLFEGRVFKYRALSRYKPLYDAVWAPFKPKFRFWVGLRLILRGFPFIFVYFFNHPINLLLLALFLVTLLWVQGMLRPFRGFARNAFDTFFLSNLLILILGALYFYIFLVRFEITQFTAAADNTIHRNNQIAFYSVVMGLAYVGFFMVFLWHLALRFPRLLKSLNYVLRLFKGADVAKSNRRLKSFTDGKVKRGTVVSKYGATDGDNEGQGVSPSDQEQSSDEEKYDSSHIVHKRKAVVTYTQYREPLLSSGSLEIDTVEKS